MCFSWYSCQVVCHGALVEAYTIGLESNIYSKHRKDWMSPLVALQDKLQRIGRHAARRCCGPGSSFALSSESK